MNIDLLRHRRNLLIVSSILVLIQLAGISIGESINLFGTNLNVENKNVIGYAIWLVWFYLFIRFYQYFIEEENVGIKAEYHGRVRNLIERHFYRKSGHGSYNPEFQAESTSGWSWLYKKRNEEKPLLEATIWLVFVNKIRAIQHVVLNTSKVTDYVLPFIVGFSPLIILMVKQCLTRT